MTVDLKRLWPTMYNLFILVTVHEQYDYKKIYTFST